ncbi:aminopeptidase P N-terminal domain-containing protein [Tenacibaculum aquimarinum]|uniref:aminopeptidase P N-terminal domain-containing protein n=1 Tax=Tenacibaculum aquimarinum TaxID=2910675 RepID=UPI001F0A3158|nr:aminopeptidase P N-terminal domain-containing protein [Tenacibaculum aquimarinum]MCH3885101.1 aminopeptidase P N-terminal domain-containing protein [Tenacibaculum aquimarinum]
MKLYNYLIILALLFASEVFSQTPTDFLSAEFHKERRATLRAKMPANSVAVVFANPIRNRANDVDYVFHQDPNFYYLTGYREPNAVLVIYSDNQTDASGNTFNEVLYVQKKDKVREQWDGKRLGVEGAKTELGFAVAKNGEEFAKDNINFKNFTKVFAEKFKDDYRNSSRNNAEVYDLVNGFKNQSGYGDIKETDPNVAYVYNMIANVPDPKLEEVAKSIYNNFEKYPAFKNDELINKYATATNNELRKELKQKMIIAAAKKPDTNIDTKFLSTKMAEMREIKSEAELKLLTKAIRISAVGQIEMMKAMKPHMSETEIQGIHEFVYKKYGAEYEGYPSIVGAGNNGCILHYIENNRTHVDNDLVLMDLGAEYRGYTADVTRTIPANGKFSAEQKAIYNIVLEAQDKGIAASTVGGQFWQPGEEAKKVINKGLFDLGIIKSIDEKHNYFPHGTSHHIGLDVHDPGTYGAFKENMVITVEPGIYIPDGSNCDKKWWGIAVRIEDDILITKNGPKNLSEEAPRTVEAIEKMMAKKSVLDDFILPSLD